MDVAGTGTVTSVDSGTGLTGGPITGYGTLSLADIAAYSVLANATGIESVPGAVALTRGSLLTRDGTALTTLPLGTVNQVLTSDGTDVLWSDVPMLICVKSASQSADSTPSALSSYILDYSQGGTWVVPTTAGTNVFRVPKDGIYLITWNVTRNSSVDQFATYVSVNTTVINGSAVVFGRMQCVSQTISSSCQVPLVTTDDVRIFVYSDATTNIPSTAFAVDLCWTQITYMGNYASPS
jgi:hypothetical protein